MSNYYDTYVNTTLADGNTTSQQFVNATQFYYDQTFKESPNYVPDATLNGIQTDIRVESMKAKQSSNKPDGEFKHILLRDLSLKTNYGDIFHFWNDDWLVIDRKISSPASNTCDVEHCNNVLKFKNSQGNIVSTSCVCDALGRMYLDIQNDKTIIVPKDIYLIRVQSNEDTLQIIESMRFILFDDAFKIMAKTKIIINGMIEFKLQSDLFREGLDNVDGNGLADQSVQQNIIPTNLAISGATSPKINSTGNVYTLLNNTVPNTFTWSLVDAISGGITSYGSITSSTTTTCTISIGATSGKQLKLLATCIETPTTVLSLIISVSAGF